MDWDIPIYCLAFDGSERKKRMEDRFSKLNLTKYVKYQEPVTLTDPLIDHYLQNRGEISDQGGRRAASGTISYLKMVRSFAESGKPYGIFCEDDVHIRKSIKEDIPLILDLIKSLKEHPDVILLGYLAIMSPLSLGFPLYQYNPPSIVKAENGNTLFYLLNYDSDLWGGQMMLLSHDNAVKALNTYDKPFYLSCPNSAFVLDWTLTKMPKRLLVYPMIGVEEGKISDNHPGQVYFHQTSHNLNYDPNLYV